MVTSTATLSQKLMRKNHNRLFFLNPLVRKGTHSFQLSTQVSEKASRFTDLFAGRFMAIIHLTRRSFATLTETRPTTCQPICDGEPTLKMRLTSAGMAEPQKVCVTGKPNYLMMLFALSARLSHLAFGMRQMQQRFLGLTRLRSVGLPLVSKTGGQSSNTIHGPEAWDANPWVVAIRFDVLHGNIDMTAPSVQVPA